VTEKRFLVCSSIRKWYTHRKGRLFLEFYIQDMRLHGNWTVGNFIEESITKIRETVKDGRVINALFRRSWIRGSGVG